MAGLPVCGLLLPHLVDGASGPDDWLRRFDALVGLMAVLGLVLVPGRMMIKRSIRKALSCALADQRAAIPNERGGHSPRSVSSADMNRLDLVPQGKRATI